MPVEEGSWPRLSPQGWAEYLEDIQFRPVVGFDPCLRDGSGITYVQVNLDTSEVESSISRLTEGFSRLAGPAQQAGDAMAEMSAAVEAAIRLRRTGEMSVAEYGYLPGGFLPEPRLVRSPLGAAEDPHEWTLPADDRMHWTPPETDGEVPRWLA